MIQDQKILDGKKIAFEHEQILKKKIRQLNLKPKMVSFLIGNDPSSILYSHIKKKKAMELGIDFQIREINCTHPMWQAICDEIERLNKAPEVTGIMVQLPVPKEFLGEHSIEELLEKISPQKDVDGLTYPHRWSTCVPAAVRAVLIILKEEEIAVKGKKVVVLGKSNLVGKPVAEELKKLGARVQVCDSQTVDLCGETLKADIIICATGKPGILTGEMVKNGVVVIDIGAEKVNGKAVGDVDFPSVYPKASKITPVPGGVGPVTVIALMENMVGIM